MYVGWASHGDNGPYHGWVIGFDHTTLQPVAGGIFNDTPNGSQGGIWMSGAGLAADSSGNIYFTTGNGTFDANVGGSDYGDSAIKLSTSGGLSVADYFTPSNELYLDQNDLDFGSGGVMLLPDQPGLYPHLLVTSYKLGTLDVINRDNMGRFNPTTDNIVQELPGALGGTWNMPAYFNGTIYYNSAADVLKAFHLFASDATTSLTTVPVTESANPIVYPGDTPSISSNGTNNGIVWTLQTDGYASGSPAVLHAYDASDVSRELYNSSQAGAARRASPGYRVHRSNRCQWARLRRRRGRPRRPRTLAGGWPPGRLQHRRGLNRPSASRRHGRPALHAGLQSRPQCAGPPGLRLRHELAALHSRHTRRGVDLVDH